MPCNAEDLGAFALDKTGSRFRAALVRVRPDEKQTPYCTFLVRAPGGAARCGLGEGRPVTCQTFPAQVVDGEIQFETSGCTCDWSNAAGDPGDQDALRAQEQEREHYATIVASWNEYVAQLAGSAKITYEDFCRYLLDTYSP